jgi:O-antigen ligase
MSEKLLVLFSLVFAALLGGVLAAVPPQLLPFLIGGCVLAVMSLLSLLKPIFLLYFVILTSAFGGLFRIFGALPVGGTSMTVSGFRWVIIAGIALFVVLANARRVKLPRAFYPFIVFVLWVALRWLTGPLDVLGATDVLFFGLPLVIAVYALFVLSSEGARTTQRIQSVVLYSAFLPPLLYTILIPLGLVSLTEGGPQGVLGPRSVALYLLVVLSLSLAHWRYSDNRTSRKQGILISLLAAATIFLTLSRIASLVVLFLFSLSRINPRRLWNLAIAGAVALMLGALLLLSVPAFEKRTFFRTDVELRERIRYFSTAGRNVMWPATFSHALENPLIGWGPGSARRVVARVLTSKDVEGYHPHNEYLHVFHDMGAIGLVLLLAAWIPLSIRHWRDWRSADLSGNRLQAKWSMAASLAIASVLITSVTDNTLHYVHILGPVFIIVAVAQHWSSVRHETNADARPMQIG